ncbi:B30.2/SPRY domain-containing protein [Caenorhabditis elegans]|nr:B30.2/SPRY domain-containing protein [Caenorhabditis elegans]CAB63361.1 B30.2/SPRY domain-containing protein [Caenorhabditis elegans]|eukprot:NP_001255854.1 Heterogeneous nuclear RibonucleoProtein U [Caenorhabditis elegans]
MELGDGDGEYNPEDSAIGQDESEIVWEYQPIMTRMEDEEEEMEENEGDDEDEDEMVMDDEEEDDDEDEEEATNLDAPEAPEALEAQEDPEELNVLEQNPMELLKRALPLLHSSTVTEQPKHDYAQLELPITESLLKRTDDEQPEEVYYHGDPVPEVDENELYEIAAGIKPKKKEKKALVQIPEEERVPADSETIELDYYNADILVKSAEKDIWQIEPFNQDGLALMWGGIRSNFGIKLPFKQTGKDASHRLAFQIQIDSYQSIQHLPTEFMADGGDVRIGFSLASTASLILGESPGSWCISASGKRAANNHFSDFGKLFDIGDVVTCIFDLSVGTISYQINGENVGSPFESLQFREGDVIFPTICTKNANINVNMGQELTDEKWKIPEDRDWMFITEMDRAHLVRSHTAPAAKKDCTVLMTVGLPGVGKTTWVRRYLAEHPHEHWTLISADVVMDAMKVNGVPRIRLPTLKRPDFLRGIIGKSMNRLILLAPRRRKNYILDMTNCFAEKRKRKLMAFEEFNRKCMLFVPDEDTHQKRLIKQEHEENEKLDTDAMMQHKAAMSLPIVAEGEPCEELIFIDPPAGCEQIAFDRVGKMNYDCRSWLVIPGRRRGGGGYNNHHNRGDRGGGGGNYHHGGYHQYNRPSTSGPPSGGAQYSPRGSSSSTMNITHTTFPSVPSPLVREEPTIILPPVKIGLPVVVSTADDSSSPTVAAAVVVAGNNQFSFPPPPVVMAAPASAAPQTPIQQQQKIQQVQQPKKVEVSQPLTLNTSSLPRKSTDSSAGPLSIVSSAGGRSSSFTQQSPRFATTPIPSVIPPTTTPVQQIPVMMNISQPPPQIMMSIPPPSMMVQHMRQPPVVFPIDVTVPPPNFSAPPPMLPASAGIPPHLLMYHHHQMSAPPPPTTTPQQAPQFSYPPPQFAPR